MAGISVCPFKSWSHARFCVCFSIPQPRLCLGIHRFPTVVDRGNFVPGWPAVCLFIRRGPGELRLSFLEQRHSPLPEPYVLYHRVRCGVLSRGRRIALHTAKALGVQLLSCHSGCISHKSIRSPAISSSPQLAPYHLASSLKTGYAIYIWTLIGEGIYVQHGTKRIATSSHANQMDGRLRADAPFLVTGGWPTGPYRMKKVPRAKDSVA